MNFRQTLVISALAVLLSSSCFAVSFTENAAIFKGDDNRLDQLASCNAEGIPIYSVLDMLSNATGVTMNAGQDKNDWMARDRKLIIHVKDMKLTTLMQEIASVLHFHWSRTGSAEKSIYYLWQDNQQRAEEESLRASADDEETKAAREKRENALSDMANLGSLAEKDAASLKTADPWRYILATEPMGRGVTEFLNNFAEARAALVQGTEASFPVSALTPQLQDAVHKIADSYETLTQKIGMAEASSGFLNQFDKLQVTINRHVANPAADAIGRSLLGRITLTNGIDSMDIPLFEPASPVGKALGKAILALESGSPKDIVGKHLETEMTAALRESQAAASPARDISSDPALKSMVKLFTTATKAPLPVVLGNLADKSKLDVISDYFPGTQAVIPGGEKSLGSQLETIASAFGTKWEKSGHIIRFRDTQWFDKRAWDVPEVWMKYWSDRAKINNSLQLPDLVQIGCLRDVQIDHTILSDPLLTRYGVGDVARNRQILRFYGMLTEDQRKALISAHLPVNTLTDDQWAALQRALASKGAAYAGAAKGSQFVQFTQSGDDIVEYTFSYYPGSNDAPVKFVLQSGSVYKTDDELPNLPPGKNNTK